MNNPVLQCQNLGKSYEQGKIKIEILKGIEFTLFSGQTVAIVGASGSGKSTLLNILGTLDQPTRGEVTVTGINIKKLNEKEKAALRSRHIGFVYQFHHLLPEFTALENVAMPLLFKGERIQNARKQAEKWLERVGLTHRAQHRPGQLSGGERQRVAVARALAPEPTCVLMDEPTGNLDPETAQSVQSLLWSLVEDKKTSFVLVTHDLNLAAKMNKTLVLKEGILMEASR